MYIPLIHKTLALIVVALLFTACQRDYYIKPAENVIPVNQPGDSKLSCTDLDIQIGMLQQQAIAMVPKDFSSDAGNNAAIFAGTFLFTPAYLYLLQNEMVDKPKDFERINAMAQRIELLQRLKAQKHCFERQ